MDQNPSLRLLFFGKVAELMGCHEFTCHYFSDTAQLTSFLLETYPDLKTVGFVISVNRKVVTGANLKPTDEVALLPPFSGG